MNRIKASILVGTLSFTLGASIASAHTVIHEGYVTDSQNKLVRDGFGDCVKTGYWTKNLAIPECDSSLVKQAAPAPIPAPVAIPAPEPVVAAPAPAPVVVEAPAPVVEAIPPTPPAPEFKKVVTEKAMTIEGTSFDSGSAKLKPAANVKLDEAVAFANEYKDANLTVTGFTDSQGSAQKNITLSAARAATVKQYLVKHGVAADRIVTKGEGEANPVGDNKTASGRAANRRVEIHTSVKQEATVRVN